MTETTRSLNITPEEIESGKTMAILAYLIFFIPLLMEDAKKNKFAMYHTEQGIVLFIFSLIVYIVAAIIGMITCGIGFILYIVPVIYIVIGIINAAGGKVKPLPLIGQYGEKFNLVK
jgi:uncharacterized membrane protein